MDTNVAGWRHSSVQSVTWGGGGGGISKEGPLKKPDVALHAH